MGEEYELSNLILQTPDGKQIHWDGLTTATIVPEESEERSDELYATIKNTESFEFECEVHISRKSLLLFLVGDNKRMIRRALRWNEKLRRLEIKSGCCKIGNRLDLAAQAAQFKGNNGKHAGHNHIFTYTLRFEREE